MSIMQSVETMPFDERLHRSFMDLNEVRRKHHEYIKAKHKISGLEMEIIQWIILNGKQRMKDISEHFNVKFSTLTNIIDKIESQKLVSRKNSKNDRRVVYLEATRKGEKLYADYSNHIQVVAQMMAKEMSDEQFGILLEGLEKMAEIAGRQA